LIERLSAFEGRREFLNAGGEQTLA
jgi:hypothetical protein